MYTKTVETISCLLVDKVEVPVSFEPFLELELVLMTPSMYMIFENSVLL